MNDQLEQVTTDDAQFVVLGTILSGVLPEEQSIEAGRLVKDAGGIELFDAEWSRELWRRADAAMQDGKPPRRFLHTKQVEDVPMDIIVKLMDSALSIGLLEQVYLPELATAAVARKMRRAMKDA